MTPSLKGLSSQFYAWLLIEGRRTVKRAFYGFCYGAAAETSTVRDLALCLIAGGPLDNKVVDEVLS